MLNFEIPEISATKHLHDFNTIGNGYRGVYVFRNMYGDCLYVGQSKTLRQRLTTHVRKSPFSAHISSVDLYFLDEGFDREICETVFIDRLKPRYNKDKVFREFAEDVAITIDKIEELECERTTLSEELWGLREMLRRDTNEDYFEGEDDYYTDEDELCSQLLGEDLRGIERISEIEDEIPLLSGRINSLYTLIR